MHTKETALQREVIYLIHNKIVCVAQDCILSPLLP